MIDRAKMEEICRELEKRLEAELGYRPALVLLYADEECGCSFG